MPTPIDELLITVEVEQGSKLEELYNMGFSGSKEIKKYYEDKSKYDRDLAKKNQEKAKLDKLEYYQLKYLFNKFIDEESVKKICKKYGLYLCKIEDYIGDIPTKNKKELLKFRVWDNDIRETEEIISLDSARLLFPIGAGFQALGYQTITSPLLTKIKSPVSLMSDKLKKIKGKNLLIIAPEDKIDMRGKEKRGHKIIDDPIILQPVEYGYLIITAWGAEASDIVNEKNN